MTENLFKIRKGLTVANTSGSANLVPNELKIGSTVVNSTTANVSTVLATTVNAAGSNFSGQINTATIRVSTSANVGTNVQLNTAALTIFEATTNLVANSTIVKIASASGTANLQPTQLAIGTTVVNATSVNAAAVYYAGAAVARLSAEDQSVSGGAVIVEKDLGTIASGTLTPDPGDRAMQFYTNNGAHTLAPGSNIGTYILSITNGATAGAITTTGWTKVTGDDFTTTLSDKFRCSCSIGASGSLLIIQAMQ